MIEIEKLKDIPPGDNPFGHDQHLMGKTIATNLTVMFGTFPQQKASYIVIINTETGERIKIWFGPGHNGEWNESHTPRIIENKYILDNE